MNDLNLIDLPLVGEGTHGKIYRLDTTRCVKVYKKEKHVQMEFKVLKHAERYSHFPRVYEYHGKCMIREYLDGPGLDQYIKENRLNKILTEKILEIIDIFRELGFTRLDCKLSHIIVTQGENLKVIDPTRNMDKIGSYPRRILEDLNKLGCKQLFLGYVQELRPIYYEAWKDK